MEGIEPLEQEEIPNKLNYASELISEYFNSVSQDLKELRVYKNMGCEVLFFRWEKATTEDKTQIIDYLNVTFSAELPSDTELIATEQEISITSKNKEFLFIFNEHEKKVFLKIDKVQNREFIVEIEDNKHRLFIRSQPSKFSIERLVHSLHELRLPLIKVLEITVPVLEEVKKNYPSNGIIYSNKIVEIVRKTIEDQSNVDPALIEMFEKRYQKTDYVQIDNGKSPKYDLYDKKIRELIKETIKENFGETEDVENLFNKHEVSSKWVIEIRDVIRKMGISVISEITLKSIIYDLATRPPMPWIKVGKLDENDLRETIEEIDKKLTAIRINYDSSRLYLVEKDIPEVLNKISTLILNKYDLMYINTITKPFETLRKLIINLINGKTESKFSQFKNDLADLGYKVEQISKSCSHLKKYAYRPRDIAKKTFLKVNEELETLFIVSRRIYENKELIPLYNNFQKSLTIEEKTLKIRPLFEKILEMSDYFSRKGNQEYVFSLDTLKNSQLYNYFGSKVDIVASMHIKDKLFSYNDMFDIYAPFIAKIKKSEISSKMSISLILPGMIENESKNFICKVMDKEGYIIFLDSKDLDTLMRNPKILSNLLNSKFAVIIELLTQSQKLNEGFTKTYTENLSKILLNTPSKDVTEEKISHNAHSLTGTPIIIPRSFILSDIEQKLIKNTFLECYSVEILSKFTSGFSETNVFKVQPCDKEKKPQINKVLKIGPSDTVNKEIDNYNRYVLNYLDRGHHAEIDSCKNESRFSIICYHFVGGDGLNIVSFKDFFNRDFTKDDYIILDVLYRNVLNKFYANYKHKNINVYDYLKPLLLDKKILDFIKEISEFDGRIYLKEVDKHCTNPLKYIKALNKELTIPIFESTAHGDLNANNIQIEIDKKNIWLIDFYKTEPQHIMKDFTKLESVIKFELMDIDLESYIKFENLILSSINLDVKLYKELGLNSKFEKSFKYIQCIRDNAIRLLYPPVHFEEYLISLLYHSVSPLSWDKFDSDRKKRALYSSALIVEKLMNYPHFQVGN